MTIERASDNPFPSILMVEGDPEDLAENPATGQRRLAVGTDHILYLVDDTGTKTEVGGSSGLATHLADTTDAHDASAISFTPNGSIAATDVQTAIQEVRDEAAAGAGSVATDAIWDAAGDLAVGSGANTAAKLAIGNAGAVLARINGAVAWNAGTSFPTAAAGDRYFRTDLGMECYYDGTRWLTTQLFRSQFMPRLGGTLTTSTGDVRSAISSTVTYSERANTPSLNGGSDIWLVDHRVTFDVESGGTALSGSHKWVGTMVGVDSANAVTGTLATLTIDSGSSGVYRVATTAIGALQPAGTVYFAVTWTKTGTPGNLEAGQQFSYRIVAT